MERSEPTLVPQWLRSSGGLTGSGTTIHPLASSSSLRSDDRDATKLTRNKSLVNKNDHNLGRSSFQDRTTSSYFRRSSSNNNSSNLRASSGFGRNQRDKVWDKEVSRSRNKNESILADHRYEDYLHPLENILPSRAGKEGLRRSQSVISEGRGEMWPRKVVTELSFVDRNGNAVSNGLSAKGNAHKSVIGRGISPPGEKEELTASEIGRIPSPGLSPAIQSLPVDSSAMIAGDKWKSALAEVPAVVGNDGTSISSGKTATAPASASASVSLSKHTGLNMAETVAQGPPRAQTPPQLSTETQRLEELAIKQSRQLIPVTPSVHKVLVLNSSDKLKTKVGQQQQPASSSTLANHSPRGGPVKPDLSRTPSVGKLHVLKPTWERNGVSSAAKDSLSPTSGSRVANSTLAAAPSVGGSPAAKNSAHPSGHPTTERKPVLQLLEKRPTSQAQSRNDFFNLVRKKSVANSSPITPAGSPSALNKADEIEGATSPATQQSGDASLSDNVCEDQTPGNKSDGTCNGNSGFGQGCVDSGKSNSSFDLNFFSEEEEAAFLRSLGWEENAEEDVLTEEEINAFYRDVTKYINSKPSWKILQGTQPRFLLPLGSVGGIPSGLKSSGSKLES